MTNKKLYILLRAQATHQFVCVCECAYVCAYEQYSQLNPKFETEEIDYFVSFFLGNILQCSHCFRVSGCFFLPTYHFISTSIKKSPKLEVFSQIQNSGFAYSTWDTQYQYLYTKIVYFIFILKNIGYRSLAKNLDHYFQTLGKIITLPKYLLYFRYELK